MAQMSDVQQRESLLDVVVRAESSFRCRAQANQAAALLLLLLLACLRACPVVFCLLQMFIEPDPSKSIGAGSWLAASALQ